MVAFSIGCSTKEGTSRITVHIKPVDIFLDQGSNIALKWKITNFEGQRLLSYFDPFRHSLEFHEFETGKLYHRIPFEKEGPNGMNVVDYFLYGDKIMIVGLYHLYEINRTGEVESKLPIHNLDPTQFQEINGLGLDGQVRFHINSNYHFESYYYHEKSNSFFLITKIAGYHFDEHPFLARIDQTKNTIEFFNIVVPNGLNQLRAFSKRQALSDYYYPYLSIGNNQLIYNFPSYNSIYVTSLTDLKKNKWRNVNLANNEAITNEIKTTKGSNALTENIHYGPFIYDSFRNIYYRITYLPLDPNDAEKTRQTSVLSIFNEAFQLLHEEVLPARVRVRNYQVEPEGLYFYSLSGGDENTITLELISIEYL